MLGSIVYLVVLGGFLGFMKLLFEVLDKQDIDNK